MEKRKEVEITLPYLRQVKKVLITESETLLQYLTYISNRIELKYFTINIQNQHKYEKN